MTEERNQPMSYEALYRELMRKPVPREGFIIPKRTIDLLLRGDGGPDPYERWLEAQGSTMQRNPEISG